MPLGLDALPGDKTASDNKKSGPDVKGNPLYHQYICVDRDGKKTCGGETEVHGGHPVGPGAPSKDSFVPERCEKVRDKDNCVESCLLLFLNSKDRPYYDVSYGFLTNGSGMNCQQWAAETYNYCVQGCASHH
jgi:hypothetical protein